MEAMGRPRGTSGYIMSAQMKDLQQPALWLNV
jgi:hypothetical protein